jgi:hypothetical protein
VNGQQESVAVVKLKLDKTVEPLPKDTHFRVRPRSALGLKYVEITPGTSKATYTAGDTVPLKYASQPLDLEDVFSTFDDTTRRNVQLATQGFGDAFAGRGPSINEAIGALDPFFKYLTPVMKNLSNPDTQLDNFFVQLGRTAAQVAPVATTQAQLFTNMADTFAAFSECPSCLQQTIEKSPPTLDTSIRSLRVQRPFLGDFADLSARLRPTVNQLPVSLPKISSAFKVGTPVLPRTVQLNEDLKGALDQLDNLFENPSTLLALKDLRTTLAVGRPALTFIAPYQTVCNYTVYFFAQLSEVFSPVQHGPGGGGTILQNGLKLPNSTQANNYGTSNTSRPVDVRTDQNPIGAKDDLGMPLHRLYAQPYPQAIDAQGNADCQAAQVGYVKGPLAPNARYPRGQLSDGTPNGGNWAVTDPHFPVVLGGTYVSRKLGINNLKDVP